MQAGSSVEGLASAHAWITLENGNVIDLTLNSSLAHKLEKEQPDWNNAIYLSSEMGRGIVHIPIMLGTEYQLRAIVASDDFAQSYFLDYSRRLSDLLNFNGESVK